MFLQMKWKKMIYVFMKSTIQYLFQMLSDYVWNCKVYEILENRVMLQMNIIDNFMPLLPITLLRTTFLMSLQMSKLSKLLVTCLAIKKPFI